MISVVIPAYNEESYIDRCLLSLVAQETSHQFEVIVVDNGSTDNTVREIKRYKTKLPVRVVVEKKKGRGAARRTGFAAAKGDIILSTDADTAVPARWIEALVDRFADMSVVAITGTATADDGSPIINRLFTIGQPLAMKLYRMLFGHYWLSGFNFGIRKEIYEISGGFNAALNIQEDIVLSFQVAKLGRIGFVGDLPVVCSSRRFKHGLLNGIVQYIQTFIECFLFKNTAVVLNDER